MKLDDNAKPTEHTLHSKKQLTREVEHNGALDSGTREGGIMHGEKPLKNKWNS